MLENKETAVTTFNENKDSNMLNQKTNLYQIYLKGLNSMMNTTKTNKQTMSKKSKTNIIHLTNSIN